MNPQSFRLEFHITNKCNLRCKHCYQEKYSGEEMTLDQMDLVLAKYVDLLKKWGIANEHAYLTIIGGEPFMRPDLFRFLARVYKNSRFFNWYLLSNGTFVTKDVAKALKLLNIKGYQISLEGLEENTDKIRGKGAFKKSVSAIKLLVKAGIGVSVSLTITKDNTEDIFSLARFLAKIGVDSLLLRRFIPTGSGCRIKSVALEPAGLRDFFQKTNEYGRRLFEEGYRMLILFGCESPALFRREEGQKGDSKFFVFQNGSFCCMTHGSAVAVLPNGDISPCLHVPAGIVAGNILKENFEEIYNSATMKNLRDTSRLSLQCQSCSYLKNCYGGARCITYALDSRLDLPDVLCRSKI